MPTVVSRHLPQVERRRRVHAKSRKGCSNCKIRHVKCDEFRPHCKKCLMYGVVCNYGTSETTLQLSVHGTFEKDVARLASTEQVIDFGATIPHTWDTPECSHLVHKVPENNKLLCKSSGAATRSKGLSTSSHSFSSPTTVSATQSWPAPLPTPFTPVSMTATMATLIDDSLQLDKSVPNMQPRSESGWNSPVSYWHFSEKHLEILARFRDRTALTIGDKSLAPAYRDLLCQLAMTHAFLMHMLLSLTLMHDADFAATRLPSTVSQTKRASLQHWNTASKLFNNILAAPIRPHQQDAIWATGVVIGAAAFWFVNSDKVEEVWPLKPDEPDDLGWLRLGEGKKALWKISQPTRADSMFRNILLFRQAYCHSEPDWARKPDATVSIPQRVKQIFNVTPTSTVDNNVYLLALITISRLQNKRLRHDNAIDFLLLLVFLPPELISLLESKDTRAVFLIGWWFKLMSDGDLWWAVSRAKIEGRAVRIWLEREDKTYGLGCLLDELVRKPELQSSDSKSKNT